MSLETATGRCLETATGSPQRSRRRRERAWSSPRSVAMDATSRRRRHPLQSRRMGLQAHGAARRWQARSTRHQSPRRGTSPADGGSVTSHSCATSATSAPQRRAGIREGRQVAARARTAKTPAQRRRRTPTRAATPATAAAASTNRRTLCASARSGLNWTAPRYRAAAPTRQHSARSLPPWRAQTVLLVSAAAPCASSS